MTLYRDCPIEADIVISNANLGEMNLDCLRYVLQLSRQMLERSDVSLFLFANPGACHMSTAKEIKEELAKAAYEPALERNVFALTPEGKTVPAGLVDVLEDHIPLYDPSGFGKTVAIRDFVDFSDDDASDEFYFNAFANGWVELGLENGRERKAG